MTHSEVLGKGSASGKVHDDAQDQGRNAGAERGERQR